MRRFLTLTAITVIGIATAAAFGGHGAAAAPADNGDGTQTACVVTNPDNSRSACLKLTTGGRSAGGQVFGTGSVELGQPYTGEKILRFQIDRVSVKTVLQALAVSGSVNSGTTRNPISAATSAADPYYVRCDVRYHTVLDYSVRLTDGGLVRRSFTGPWFDSGHPTCAGGTYGPATSSERCFVRFPDGSTGACIDLAVTGVVSNDGRSTYARGSVTDVDWIQGADRIARVQVDHVDLRQDGRVVAHSGAVNSGFAMPPAAEAQTGSGRPWSGCASSYRVQLFYSVRMTSTSVVTGSLATQTFKAPGC